MPKAYVLHMVGAALVFGLVGLALANRVPPAVGVLLEAAAIGLGVLYGFLIARRRDGRWPGPR